MPCREVYICLLLVAHDSGPRGPVFETRWWQSYLRDMGLAGLSSVWAMARRRPKKYRRKVDAVARCSGVYPHI